MNGSDSNIARDAYTSSSDPYATKNPYSGRDPYSDKNPYENSGKEDKENSIYGYGEYCDHFFEIENLFRTKYTDDTQIHSEKRKYIGTGDIAAVLPKMSKITASTFFLITTAFIIDFLIIVIFNNNYAFFASLTTLTLIFAWRFICPAYLIYNAKQYIINDEYKSLYKNFKNFFHFMEILNFSFASFVVFFTIFQLNSIAYLVLETYKYLKKTMPFFTTYMDMIKKNIYEGALEKIMYIGIAYMLLITIYHLYFMYFNRYNVQKKLIKNIKDIKLKRLANLYKRKAFILNGEI